MDIHLTDGDYSDGRGHHRLLCDARDVRCLWGDDGIIKRGIGLGGEVYAAEVVDNEDEIIHYTFTDATTTCQACAEARILRLKAQFKARLEAFMAKRATVST